MIRALGKSTVSLVRAEGSPEDGSVNMFQSVKYFESMRILVPSPFGKEKSQVVCPCSSSAREAESCLSLGSASSSEKLHFKNRASAVQNYRLWEEHIDWLFGARQP